MQSSSGIVDYVLQSVGQIGEDMCCNLTRENETGTELTRASSMSASRSASSVTCSFSYEFRPLLCTNWGSAPSCSWHSTTAGHGLLYKDGTFGNAELDSSGASYTVRLGRYSWSIAVRKEWGFIGRCEREDVGSKWTRGEKGMGRTAVLNQF